MDQEQFQPTARELLERHIAETNQRNGGTPETPRVPEQEPTRPEGHPAELAAERAGYSYGGMARQQAAALRTNDRINQEYFEYHATHGSEQRQDARAALEEHIEKSAPEEIDRSSAREALQQHLQGAKHEVTEHKVDPFSRNPQRQPQDIEL